MSSWLLSYFRLKGISHSWVTFFTYLVFLRLSNDGDFQCVFITVRCIYYTLWNASLNMVCCWQLHLNIYTSGCNFSIQILFSSFNFKAWQTSLRSAFIIVFMSAGRHPLLDIGLPRGSPLRSLSSATTSTSSRRPWPNRPLFKYTWQYSYNIVNSSIVIVPRLVSL